MGGARGGGWGVGAALLPQQVRRVVVRGEPCLGTRLGSGERGKRQRGECLQKDGVELGSESRTADVGEGLIGEDGVVKAKSNFPLNPAARPNGY